MSFEALNLDARLLRAIEKLKFTNPTPIQAEAIPVVLEGRDLMASAQTGTGKTAAFMLPALHKLLTSEPKAEGRGPRVLVLTPTRELAQQVTEAVHSFGKGTKLTAGAVVGGVSYYIQEKLLASPLDILVATPGRLMDHMDRGRIDFSRLELFILDEADRMLDMGFIEDIEKITQSVPSDRQTLLFSATLDGDIARIAKKLLKDPARISISSQQAKHESITQSMLIADDIRHKHALLAGLLEDTGVYQAVVFVATRQSADDVADLVKDMGHTSSALHGDMRQNVRSRVIEKMHRGKLRVLVATDVAARGLDVKGLTHVINFDLPRVSEDYVHRIGRTGRAGAEGIAISLVGPQDWQHLTRIEKLIGEQVKEIQLEGLEPRSRRPLKQDRAKPSNARRGRDRNSGGGSGYASKRTATHQHAPRSGDDNRGNYQGRNDNVGNSFAKPARSRSEFAGTDARPARPYGDHPARSQGDARPARSYSEDRPVRSGQNDTRPARPYGDRPARGQGDARPVRSYSEDRPARGQGDARPARSYNEDRPVRSGQNDTRPARPRSEFTNTDARPARPYGDRPARGQGDARPARSYSEDRPARAGENRNRPQRARTGDNYGRSAPRDERYVAKGDRVETSRPQPKIVLKRRTTRPA